MSENNKHISGFTSLGMVLNRAPEAMAIIRGNQEYPQITGMVRFYQATKGVLVAVEIMGLPQGKEMCSSPFFGFHIHEGGMCSGDEGEPFAHAKAHYNPGNCRHPFHAGDLPPILGNCDGHALNFFLTDRFSVAEIVGKTIMIHALPDDFTSQPAGNSGERIACGQIKQWGL